MAKNLLIIDHRYDQLKSMLGPIFPELDIHTVGPRDKVADRLENIHVIMALGHLYNEDLIGAAPNLEWVQSLTTGTDAITGIASLGKQVIVTSTRGVHGPQMTEMVFLHMLNLTHDYPRMLRNQDKAVWERWEQPLLYKKTVAILGVGVIAEALAKRCKLFGMTVHGITSTVREVEGIDKMYRRDEMAEALAEADYFVVLVPHAPDTDKIVNAEVIAAMKPEAYLINVARGGVLDEDALIEALKSKRIAGAGLDVFAQEPLPADHAFWSLENLLITPKHGGMSNIYMQQVLPILEANMRHFLNGEAEKMINLVAH